MEKLREPFVNIKRRINYKQKQMTDRMGLFVKNRLIFTENKGKMWIIRSSYIIKYRISEWYGSSPFFSGEKQF